MWVYSVSFLKKILRLIGRYRHFADATELNSTSSGVELSCVAINGP